MYLPSIIRCSTAGIVTAVALSLAMAVVGCGGGATARPAAGSPSTAAASPASRPPLTRTQFGARSDSFCKASWRRIRGRFAAYQREHPDQSGRQLFARATGDVFLPIILFWYDDINSLKRPPGDSATIARILRTLDAATHGALERPYSFRSPAQLAARYRRSNRIMRSYGIDSCVVTTGSFSSWAL